MILRRERVFNLHVSLIYLCNTPQQLAELLNRLYVVLINVIDGGKSQASVLVDGSDNVVDFSRYRSANIW